MTVAGPNNRFFLLDFFKGIREKEEVRKKRSYGPNLRVNLRLLFLYEMKIRDWRINLRFSWNTGPWTSYFSSLFLINNKEKELRREVQPGPSYQEIQRLSTKRYFPFFPFYFKVKWKRKSFVTAGETWLVIPSFISSLPHNKEEGINNQPGTFDPT